MKNKSTWNWPGYAESAEAHYVQSLTETQLFCFIKNVTGKTYDLDDYPGKKKGGLIGALNRVAINHLQDLSNQEHIPGEHVGRNKKFADTQAKVELFLNQWQ